MHSASTSRRAPGCYVISLRPQGEHAGLRRHARRHGLRVFSCSPLRLVARPCEQLRPALDSPCVVFTSPAAVRFAVQAHGRLHVRAGQSWVAVGAGTARALGRLGIVAVHPLQRMDTDGLLALPALAEVDGVRIGLVTAPGGRGLIQSTLGARGAEVVRADVYTREPVVLGRARLRRLADLPRPAVLLVSSAEALDCLRAQLPAALTRRLCSDPVVVSSERLEQIVRDAGFVDPHRAHSASPPDLLATAAHAVGQGFG